MGKKYHLQVDVDFGGDAGSSYRNVYQGDSVPDAMAAWSKAISEGKEYVMLEALLEHPKPEDIERQNRELAMIDEEGQ